MSKLALFLCYVKASLRASSSAPFTAGGKVGPRHLPGDVM